mmetsp:Transcript_42548/g.132754  ORF Transcript_42548/g.132754 Transcript_42548/m.132754 type:complete len:217 (-) Transcript_42548:701-1351(-)
MLVAEPCRGLAGSWAAAERRSPRGPSARETLRARAPAPARWRAAAARPEVEQWALPEWKRCPVRHYSALASAASAAKATGPPLASPSHAGRCSASGCPRSPAASVRRRCRADSRGCWRQELADAAAPATASVGPWPLRPPRPCGACGCLAVPPPAAWRFATWGSSSASARSSPPAPRRRRSQPGWEKSPCAPARGTSLFAPAPCACCTGPWGSRRG